MRGDLEILTSVGGWAGLVWFPLGVIVFYGAKGSKYEKNIFNYFLSFLHAWAAFFLIQLYVHEPKGRHANESHEQNQRILEVTTGYFLADLLVPFNLTAMYYKRYFIHHLIPIVLYAVTCRSPVLLYNMIRIFAYGELGNAFLWSGKLLNLGSSVSLSLYALCRLYVLPATAAIIPDIHTEVGWAGSVAAFAILILNLYWFAEGAKKLWQGKNPIADA